MLKIKNRGYPADNFYFSNLYNLIYFINVLKSQRKCSTSFKDEQVSFFIVLKFHFFFFGGGLEGLGTGVFGGGSEFLF